MKNDDFQAIRDLLTNTSKYVVITAHRDPDIDAVASCLAFHFQLERLGVPHDIWLADSLDDSVQFLPGLDVITRSKHILKKADILLVLDCSNAERVSGHRHLPTDIPVINIDHHADNYSFGDYNFADASMSSVGEMCWHFFKAMNWPISANIATCLYGAISFDTGRFLYSNTSSSTFSAASDLVEKGADSFQIGQIMYETKNMETFELMKLALDRMVVNKPLKYAYTSVPKHSPDGKIKVIDFIRQLGECDIFLSFTEADKNTVKISLRSKSDFDVQHFAAKFGGGGHKKASGITIKGQLEPTIQSVITELERSIES